MKFFLNMLIALITATTVIVGVSVWKNSVEAPKHEVKLIPLRQAYSNPGSREAYIGYLKRTIDPNDPELYRRIEAAKQLESWPE